MTVSNLKAFLVDDEPMALNALERMLTKHCPKIEIIGKTTYPEEAIPLINDKKPDLLFLDIAMPKMDGFTLLKQLAHQQLHIIFVTAYDEYALKAFKTEAVDYILKPIDKDELIAAINKVLHVVESNTNQIDIADLLERLNKNQKSIKLIGLPTMEGLNFVKIEAIIYCKSDGNYTEIYLHDKGKFVVTRKIKYMEEKLGSTGFVRVHNSFLINLNYAEKYYRGRGGTVLMSNGDSIPVSVRKKNDFLDFF